MKDIAPADGELRNVREHGLLTGEQLRRILRALLNRELLQFRVPVFRNQLVTNPHKRRCWQYVVCTGELPVEVKQRPEKYPAVYIPIRMVFKQFARLVHSQAF